MQRLELWRAQQEMQFGHTYFYSDSRNDIPLLLKADTPVAVDADEVLLAEAVKRGWPSISLRDGNFAAT